MEVLWDTKAGDELLAIAKQGRDEAFNAGQIFRMMEKFTIEEVDPMVPCPWHGTIRLCWWPDQSIKAFFGVTDNTLYIAHVAVTNTPYEFTQAERLALERYRIFLN